MQSKIFSKIILPLLILHSVVSFASQKHSDTKEFPNIVYVLADDMGQGDLSCYNPQSKIPTVNLDNLAEAGMRFTDAHSGASICTPTRYGILTGRYCWHSPLKGFIICGKDHEFQFAEAIIKGKTIVVSHPDIENPVAVRYAWSDFPLCNLYNKEGLPANSFRTDK